ncbi:MAG: mechanosensitive ion channel family protein [Geobacter sp.]|nr:MAG: mechanosensitive ion channel family protein [Geobacter sp.]
MDHIPPVYLGILQKLIVSVIVIGLAVVASRLAARLFQKSIKGEAQMLTVSALVRKCIYIAAALIIASIVFGFGGNFATIIGIMGAGVAFASQEVIGSFAGYMNIITSNIFRIGDRIRIGNVAGDVLDISLLRTTVMEIGEWVKADQYTGRIVSLANRVIFSDPVSNYTQHSCYLWDEIMIPVTYDSNWQRAVEIILAKGQELTASFHAGARAEFAEMVKKYPSLHEVPVEPSSYITMTDNWIELTLRYIVEARDRRVVKGQIHSGLLKCFDEEPDIRVASMTVDIVGFPSLKSSPGSAS